MYLDNIISHKHAITIITIITTVTTLTKESIKENHNIHYTLSWLEIAINPSQMLYDMLL